jgi:hypothetical protein
MFSWLSSLSREISRMAVEGTPSSSCSSLQAGQQQAGKGQVGGEGQGQGRRKIGARQMTQ